ncbi:hypothetical protein FISHEDRAFT_55896 [Fistulina hepatica ATCC 64428]|uniref:Uncharacterized protein n=1 Tax=Fistulina hepatica ATCC 64428 TaxID=1128425 RepID=A0A0D7ANM2_9AGAR|nr:hypothetical protein FISHEDRAFT_55896 [Fistulina hepatica ATCC 64428]
MSSQSQNSGTKGQGTVKDVATSNGYHHHSTPVLAGGAGIIHGTPRVAAVLEEEVIKGGGDLGAAELARYLNMDSWNLLAVFMSDCEECLLAVYDDSNIISKLRVAQVTLSRRERDSVAAEHRKREKIDAETIGGRPQLKMGGSREVPPFILRLTLGDMGPAYIRESLAAGEDHFPEMCEALELEVRSSRREGPAQRLTTRPIGPPTNMGVARAAQYTVEAKK